METTTRLVSTMSVYPLLQCAREEGIATHALLRGSGLTEQVLNEPRQMVPFEAELAVVGNYLRHTRETHPGLRASHHYHVNSFGVLGAALVSHGSMIEACRFLVDYVELTFTPFLVLLTEDETSITARYIDRHELGACRDFYLLRDLAFIRNLCREADPERWPGMIGGVDIALPVPPDPGSIEEYFRCPLRFNAEQTRIHASKARLDGPMRLANALTLALMRRQCDELLAQRHDPSWRRRVEDLILAHDGPQDIGSVASELCCSERTLRRHLQQESCTFQDILVRLQEQRAMHLLRHTLTPVEVIAARLGYSETAAFAHAFKRWTGSTPTRVRRGDDERAQGSP